MLDGLDLAYEESDAEIRPGRHRRRRSRRGRSVFALLLVVVLLGVLGGGGYWGYTQVRGFFIAPDYTSAGHGSAQVEVHTGDVVSDIANTLYGKGVVKSAKAFVDAAGDNPNGNSIQPGFYQVHQQMKASLAVTALLDLKNRVSTKVTIQEGLTANATMAALAKSMKLPLSDFQKAAKDPSSLGIGNNWYTRLDKKRAAGGVEGFLYPDTYLFDPGTTAKEALTEMVQRFMKAATDSGLDKPAGGMSPYEALIVASMVQAEAIPSDMPSVARVVYNRLDSPDEWMHKLQFDSTTNYWLGLKGGDTKQSSNLTYAELHDASNPYNTHEHAGLPPGPIDSPGIEAMKGAAHPATGKWMYFVRIDKTGKSAFAVTYDEQKANQEKAKQNGAG